MDTVERNLSVQDTFSSTDNCTTEQLNGVIKCSVVHRGESWETL